MMFNNVVFPLPDGPNTTTKILRRDVQRHIRKRDHLVRAHPIAATDTRQLHQRLRRPLDRKGMSRLGGSEDRHT